MLIIYMQAVVYKTRLGKYQSGDRIANPWAPLLGFLGQQPSLTDHQL